MFRIEDQLDYKRMRSEGSSLTYWNAGKLQNMPIASNLESTTTSGKSLKYNGTEWNSGYTSEIGGTPINPNLTGIDGQVLTYNGTSSSWNNEYPRNLRGIPISTTMPVATQILSFDGTTWMPANNTGTQGPTGTVAFGNVIVVDKIKGTNEGTIDGNAVQDIETAIAKVVASGREGVTIWVMPGTYNISAGIVIPNNTTLKGVTLQGCIIQRTAVVANTTLITMGANSRVEDFTLNLTSASNVELKGVYFPGATSTSAKIRVCLINVTSTVVALTNIVSGIFSDGTTTNPSVILSTNAVQRTTTNVTSSNTSTTTGIVRGWYFTGSLQFSIRDAVIFAKQLDNINTVDVIGVETMHTSSFIIIKTATISGTKYDIKQPTGLTVQNSGIQLTATDLINANSDDNGFSVNIESANFSFSIFGTFVDTTHYLFPGTQKYNELLDTPVGVPFPQNVIIFGGMLSAVVPNTMTGSATIYLYNSTSSTSLSNSTAFSSILINNTTRVSIFNNKSSTFKKQINYLHVKLVCSDVGNSINALFLVLSLY
jgi:hypothetical protein